MARIARTWLLSMLIGFHNALEHEEDGLAELGIRIQAEHPDPSHLLLADPARCFFFGQSSLLN
jgi:hypothetical protein